MAIIYGWNNKNTLEERRVPSYQIQVWKAGKKQAYTYRDKKTEQQKEGEKFGNDLGFEFRIELRTATIKSAALVKSQQIDLIRNVLKQAYKAREDESGSLYVDHLNIILHCKG